MKRINKAFSCILAITALVSCVGCSGGGDNGSYTPAKEYLELSAFTNNSDSEAYDSKYFYRNDFNLASADVFAMYVPEGRHLNENGEDLYGGYYYLYTTPGDINGQGMYVEAWGEQTETSKKRATNPVLKSKDLANWELCGVYKGHSTMYDFQTQWVNSGVAAPEVIWDENTGKYYMYAQAHSHNNDGTREGAEYATSSNGHDRFYIAIFMSDIPQDLSNLQQAKVIMGIKITPI
jgi:beta-xylosidase